MSSGSLHRRAVIKIIRGPNFSHILVIGFIGLGNMGRPMARNIIKSGSRVLVYDINPDVFKCFPSNSCSNVENLVRECDVIVTMLPNGEAVKSLFENSIFKKTKDGTLLIDCSTIEPNLAISLQSTAVSYKNMLINAPVSGGVVGAVNGTLTFMAGGSQEAFKRAEPYLKTMGDKIIYCGEGGLGLVAKICNNMLLGITMGAVCESLFLGRKLGLKPEILSEIINSSTGRCWVTEKYNPVPGVLESSPASHLYLKGFSCALLAKDLTLALNEAESKQLRLNLAELIKGVYTNLASIPKYSQKDFSVLFQKLSTDRI